MSLSYFIDEWASSLNIFQLPAGVPVEITWFPGSPPEAWVQLWMNQLNGADDITDTVIITSMLHLYPFHFVDRRETDVFLQPR
jgi:hypothetical protein